MNSERRIIDIPLGNGRKAKLMFVRRDNDDLWTCLATDEFLTDMENALKQDDKNDR